MSSCLTSRARSFCPSIVLGDSRKPETNQFEMVRALRPSLAGLPDASLPAERSHPDIVPGRLRGQSDLHAASEGKTAARSIYHLSSGTGSETFQELTTSSREARWCRGPCIFRDESREASSLKR